MQRVAIKTYAVKHKLSIFNVMKMVKSGKVKTDVIEENGKEVTYILLDDSVEKEVKEGMFPKVEMKDEHLKNQVKTLSEEVKLLRDEIEALKSKL